MKTNHFLFLKHSFFLLIFFYLILIAFSLQAANIKNSAVVFMYHKFGVPKHPSTNITMEQFNKHLNELSKAKYEVKSLNYIVDSILNDVKLEGNVVGISIDDADKSFYEKAWPLLKEKGFPVTLFVTTNTISNQSKNYLNWDQIRELINEGVTIGAHSHTHNHFPEMSIEDIRNEIETSNKIFLKEIGMIPNLFAYPYGETNEVYMNLLKDYKYKVAFGQHSGVINETSNFYYLPRFSLNEKYGEIDRVIFAANAKGLGVYDFVPTDPNIFDNPPFIGFSLLDQNLSNKLNCFLFDSSGNVDLDIFKFNERIEIRSKRKLKSGRARLNCTSKDNNGWRWFGHQFYTN